MGPETAPHDSAGPCGRRLSPQAAQSGAPRALRAARPPLPACLNDDEPVVNGSAVQPSAR
jgi:hypothetical protein